MTRFEIRASFRGVQKASRGLLIALGLIAVGCGQQADTRAEARQLLRSLNDVSDRGTFQERSSAIDRLTKMSLHTSEHVQTRDVCRAAHQGLLEAETAQAEARKALSEANTRDAGLIGSQQASAVAADIERSNKALATAKQRFPECERAMRKLIAEAH
jgi:metal-responsive CopG/Arc/MetJ family transcriptional regulator